MDQSHSTYILLLINTVLTPSTVRQQTLRASPTLFHGCPSNARSQPTPPLTHNFEIASQIPLPPKQPSPTPYPIFYPPLAMTPSIQKVGLPCQQCLNPSSLQRPNFFLRRLLNSQLPCSAKHQWNPSNSSLQKVPVPMSHPAIILPIRSQLHLFITSSPSKVPITNAGRNQCTQKWYV